MGALNIVVLLILIVSVLTKPVDIRNIIRTEELVTVATEDNIEKFNLTQVILNTEDNTENSNSTKVINNTDENTAKVNSTEVIRNGVTNNVLRNQLRPGMVVNSYAVSLEANANNETFNGRAVIQVSITDSSTREDPVIFYADGSLRISSVRFSLVGGTVVYTAQFDHDSDDGTLEIDTGLTATLYSFIIEYSGRLDLVGKGFYAGHYGSNTYLAMNLHPTHARRVFPCMDEPTEVSIISFTVNNTGYTHLVSNSMLENNSTNQFRALQGPPHLWGMVAHNFVNINIPTANVLLFGRQGILNQDAPASVAINYYFNALNEWTNRPYFDIVLNQDGRMNILALPDVSTDWHALSTVGIWEPYVFMEQTHSVKQRKESLTKIAEAMAKQWFGYVIFPENFRYEWVVSGLATYAGYEMFRQFQAGGVNTDVTLLDVNTLFVTDIIQESLLRDSYSNAQILEPTENLFDEDQIRNHVFGLLKYKAPALMRMMRLVLGNANQDFIRSAARALLTGRALQTVNSLNFVDAINSDWLANGNNNVGDMDEYLETWIENRGYPLVHVGLRQGGVLITQERFGFAQSTQVNFNIPITYTTSINPDFSDNNTRPAMMTDGTVTLNMALGDDDWVLFNIQGQGYYRVNYDADLWERIIDALDDPTRRAQIHPLNRATLVDDALNLARAGRLDYETAFNVVLTMEHETEYAVWKAFVRNMEFLRKRLIALVTEDDDLDPDIYLRMVRRTIGAIEDQLGFSPDVSLTEPAMATLTRGLVMDHACKANYQPCIAAAVDWFYASNNNTIVNPNIPHELRPAVYCTMVREGDENVRTALLNRLQIEPTLYERVVILQSLACSQDSNYIRTLLQETIASNGPYSVEERVKIFTAVAESSFENAQIAMNFMSMRVNEIRNTYGGAEKLEQLIYILAENMADGDLSTDFRIWVQSQNNNLDDSQLTADHALVQVNQNMQWNNAHMQNVYDWIDENHAPTLMVSFVALCVSVMVALLNH